MVIHMTKENIIDFYGLLQTVVNIEVCMYVMIDRINHDQLMFVVYRPLKTKQN